MNSFLTGMVNPDSSGVDIGQSDITGDDATVEVTLVHNSSDPFSTGYRDTQRAILVKQNGDWKISSMPQYNFWDYNWYHGTDQNEIHSSSLFLSCCLH